MIDLKKLGILCILRNMTLKNYYVERIIEYLFYFSRKSEF